MFTQKSMQWYSPSTNKFLPDRYVERHLLTSAASTGAFDQCDNCGNVLEPEKLIHPARRPAALLELRETEHFYLDLSNSKPDVKKFLNERRNTMRDTVSAKSLRKIEAEG